MAEKKKTCLYCGLPMGIGKGNIWHPNGVITASYPPHIRGTLYDVDELNALFPALSERIGFDITHLVVEGKRKDAKRYADTLIRNLKALGRETSPMTIYGMVARFTAYWGLGSCEVEEYWEGERLSIKVKNPYSDAMSLGDWAGIFEAVERKRGEASWRDPEALGRMDIVAVEGEPELEVRIEQEVELGIPFVEEGDLQYRQCPECGVPLEISRQFTWDADASLIEEVISGKRFILHNTNGIAAVLRVLSEELGDEVNDLITDISREYARGYYEPLMDETSMDAELIKFPLRSWGRLARLHRDDGGCRMRIVNPYCVPVVAGRIWGLVEVFEEHPFALDELTEGMGTLDIFLTSA